MSLRTRVNLLLLLATVILATFLATTKQDKQNIITPTLSNISPNSIEHIGIEQHGKETVTFSKNNNRWQVNTFTRLDANPARMNAILQLLQTPSFAQLDIDTLELSSPLLQTPEITLRLDHHRFSFGNTEPIDDLRYVRFNNTIHLVEDKLYHLLRQDPLFFVNPKLIRSDLSINQIIMPKYRLYKQGETWQVTADKRQKIDADTLSNTAIAWQYAQASNIMPYSKRENLGEISVKTEQAHTIHFVIVSEKPTLVLARNDLKLEYHLDEETAKRLFLSKN